MTGDTKNKKKIERSQGLVAAGVQEGDKRVCEGGRHGRYTGKGDTTRKSWRARPRGLEKKKNRRQPQQILQDLISHLSTTCDL